VRHGLKPNIDHLIRARYVEMGFSDEFIRIIEDFTRDEVERLKKLRLNDGSQVSENLTDESRTDE
jgi:hypothetical protein